MDKLTLDNGRFCFVANVCRYLEYQGISMNEATLGILISYPGFTFSLKSSGAEETILGRNDSLEELFIQVQNCFGEQSFMISDLSTEEPDSINEIFEKNGAFLIWLDEYYLPDSYYYHKYHFKGIICVESIDLERIIIYDRSSKVFTLPEWSAVLRAQDNCCIVYRNKRLQINPGIDNKMLKQGISKIAHHMLDEDSRKEKGMTGLQSFVEFLMNCNDMDFLLSISFQLKRASSPFYSRRDIGIVLENMEAAWNCKSIAKAYYQLSDEWETMANLIFKYSKVNSIPMRERLIKRMEYICNLEREGSTRLLSLLENTK
jgi:hypothetical protein